MAAIRGIPGKIVAHGVVAGPFKGPGNTAPAIVEGYPVKIKLDRICFIQGMDIGINDAGTDVGNVRVIGISLLRVGKYDGFLIRAPARIGLDEIDIVGPGQSLQRPACNVIPG